MTTDSQAAQVLQTVLGPAWTVQTVSNYYAQELRRQAEQTNNAAERRQCLYYAERAERIPAGAS